MTATKATKPMKQPNPRYPDAPRRCVMMAATGPLDSAARLSWTCRESILTRFNAIVGSARMSPRPSMRNPFPKEGTTISCLCGGNGPRRRKPSFTQLVRRLQNANEINDSELVDL